MWHIYFKMQARATKMPYGIDPSYILNKVPEIFKENVNFGTFSE